MSRRTPPGPILLLGLLTLATFCGPLAFGFALRGGASPAWPPDRTIEWWALGLVSALVVGLMAATILSSLAVVRSKAGDRATRGSGSPSGSPDAPPDRPGGWAAHEDQGRT